MLRARDYSTAQFHRFYPSHKDRTSLTTNHVEIGVYRRRYDRTASLLGIYIMRPSTLRAGRQGGKHLFFDANVALRRDRKAHV